MKIDKLRTPVSLNGRWAFCLDPDGKKADEIVAGKSGVAWREIDLPCDLPHACPDQPDYAGRCWFLRKFSLPEDRDRRTVLRFEAVNYVAVVFVNGRFVGKNEQGFLPFELDISAYLSEEPVQTLLVMVDNSRDYGDLPSFFGWKNAGGIIRDVTLYQTDRCWLGAPRILSPADGKTSLSVAVCGELTPELTLEVVLSDAEGNELLHRQFPAEPEVHFSTQIHNPDKWSPDHPALYVAEVCLKAGDHTLDRMTERYGYRTIAVENGKITLNGTPIFLQGFNRHEDTIETGGAVCPAQTEQDFRKMKEAGANFIRMCHYPHDTYELELADQLGLILLEEIPLNAVLIPFMETVDIQDARLSQVLDSSKEMLRRLVERDRNHPCVCIWSVSNELDEQEYAINAINNTLLQYVRQLDPSRLCTHTTMPLVLTDDNADRLYHHDDIICLNQYPTMNMRQNHGKTMYDVQESAEHLRHQISRLKLLYPGKPVVVTEFGYMTGCACDGIRSEEIQSECIRAEFTAIRECAEGASVWEYADHLWPKYITMIGRELSAYGLLTRDRKEKQAFGVFSALLKG